MLYKILPYTVASVIPQSFTAKACNAFALWVIGMISAMGRMSQWAAFTGHIIPVDYFVKNKQDKRLVEVYG